MSAHFDYADFTTRNMGFVTPEQQARLGTARIGGIGGIGGAAFIVVRPGDPRPEERLGYPTLGKDWRAIDQDDGRAAMSAEGEHVMAHSTSHRYVDLEIAGEVAAGRRSRMSFAPMVMITTGMLMAYEAIALATMLTPK